jgi:predicted Zn-dependent protease
MQIVGTAAQAYVLNYSRTQEYQSDEIGVRYLKANNYNPFAAADMLSALGQQEALEAKVRDRPASSLPTWQRSHPLSADRVTRATSNARILNGSATPPAEIVGPYMEAIRGLRVGDDPEQGFINGRVFSHPTIKISFEVPAGFTLSNSPEAVQFIGPNSVKGQFAGGSTLSGRLDSYANTTLRAVLGRTPAQFGSPQATTINGFPAVSMLGRATPQGGQAIDVAVMAYNVNGKAYHFIIVGPANQLNTTFSITQSLRGLSSSDIAALRPRQIEIVTVRSGDTIASLSARMAYPDFQTDRFKMINAITTNRALINGERLKIVSYGAALR